MLGLNVWQGFMEAFQFLGVGAAVQSIAPALRSRIEKQVEARENFQEKARQFLHNETPDPQRDYIQRRIDLALRNKREHPFMEDRIHNALATMYAAGSDIQDPIEQKEWRRRAFVHFGNMAAKPKTFIMELESIESGQLRVWLRVARLCGVRVWEFIKDDTWPEIKNFVDKNPQAKRSLHILIREATEDNSSYRASIRSWMKKAQTDMLNADTERSGSHRKKDHTTLYALLICVIIVGSILIIPHIQFIKTFITNLWPW